VQCVKDFFAKRGFVVKRRFANYFSDIMPVHLSGRVLPKPDYDVRLG